MADLEDPGGLAEAFTSALQGVTLPATRQHLIEAAMGAGAPDAVISLLSALDDTAPFTSIDQAWTEAAGPDGS